MTSSDDDEGEESEEASSSSDEKDAPDSFEMNDDARLMLAAERIKIANNNDMLPDECQGALQEGRKSFTLVCAGTSKISVILAPTPSFYVTHATIPDETMKDGKGKVLVNNAQGLLLRSPPPPSASPLKWSIKKRRLSF